MIAYYLSHHLTHLDHTFSWHTTLYCKRLVIIMILNIRYHHFFQKYICHRIPFPLCRISLVMSLTFIRYHTLPQFGPLVKIANLFNSDELLTHGLTSILVDVSICFLFAVNVKVNYWGQMKILRWTVSKLLLIAFGFGKVLLFLLIWTFAKVSAIKYFCTTHDFETAAQGKRVLT